MTPEALERVTVGLPITRAGTSFMPIYVAANSLPEILAGPESALIIDGPFDATVPHVVARNPSSKPTLVLQGEHFLSGLQQWFADVTVLVPAHAVRTIPVTCHEERTRLSRKGSESAAASRNSQARGTPADHRRVSPALGQRVLRRRSVAYAHRQAWREVTAGENASQHGGTWEIHQRAVWISAENVVTSSDVPSTTLGAVEELIRIGPLPEQCGLAVAHGTWIVAIEVFGSPALLAAHWDALIRSYLIERPTRGGFPSATWALRLIRRFGRNASRPEPAVGMGFERRLRQPQMTGRALFLEDSRQSKRQHVLGTIETFPSPWYDSLIHASIRTHSGTGYSERG